MSQGQTWLLAVEKWIGSWVKFPAVLPFQARICALWAIHTWFIGRSADGFFPVTAYLHITSDGPGCGKTTLMEVLSLLSRDARVRATMRELSVVRDISDTEAHRVNAVTYFFDQVEALQAVGKISDGQAILLTGYRDGGEHGISVGSKQVAFSTYCAKAFACIGDVAPDLRSRSIVVRLGYGVPERDWSDNVMGRKGEADQLLAAGRSIFGEDFQWVPTWTVPPGLTGREKEIWTPLYSVAKALNLDAATMGEIEGAMGDFVEFKKTAETRSYRDVVTTGDRDADREYAIRALRDLAAVLTTADKVFTGNIHTATAVDKMKALPGSPWRVFKGQGLTADTLSGLVARFGLRDSATEKGNIVRERRGRSGKLARGYRGAAVRAAVKSLDGGQDDGKA